MELTDAMEIALDGNAVLFVGAGFSLGAMNQLGAAFLNGPLLARRLGTRCGLSDETPLEDAAEIFLERFGKDALITELLKQFSAQSVADYHRVFAQIPWRRIYTTNYDNVIETAYTLENKVINPVTPTMAIYDIPKDKTLCVHLSGFVGNLTRDKVSRELKLTEMSFEMDSLDESPWLAMFQQDVHIARAVFFVGYSLHDLDIKRALVESQVNKEKCFFAVGNEPGVVVRHRVQRFGTVLPYSAQDIARLFTDMQASYSPQDLGGFYPVCLREDTLMGANPRLSDADFIELLGLGKRSRDLVAESLRTGRKYYLERSGTDRLFRYISEGERAIAVSSDLGNGKSLFLDGVRCRALERGYRVFEVTNHGTDLQSELQQAVTLPGKVLITIDGYHDYLDEIRVCRLNCSDEAVLVLAERNAIHDVTIDDLTDVTGLPIVPEIRLDILDSDEIEWLVSALDEFGLWGELAGLSPRAKATLVERECQRQFHAVLLRVLESSDIYDRLSRLHQELLGQQRYHDVVLTVFLLAMLHQAPTVEMLTAFCGVRALQDPGLRRSPIVRQLVDFNMNSIVVRSSVAAQYLLKSMADSDLENVVAALIKIGRRAHELAGLSPEYKSLFEDLMRFSTLAQLLPDQGRRPATIRFYEAMKGLHRCQYYPLFWLQYAIACLVFGDLARSKTYFSTAYALAEKKAGIPSRLTTTMPASCSWRL